GDLHDPTSQVPVRELTLWMEYGRALGELCCRSPEVVNRVHGYDGSEPSSEGAPVSSPVGSGGMIDPGTDRITAERTIRTISRRRCSFIRLSIAMTLTDATAPADVRIG